MTTWANNWNGVNHDYEPPSEKEIAEYARDYSLVRQPKDDDLLTTVKVS